MKEYKSNYKIACLCGSTKFKDDYIGTYEELSKNRYITLTVGMFGHADNRYEKDLTEDVKIILDVMHFEKMLMSDVIVVINKDGYIGYSTKREIEFAHMHDIPVVYLYAYDIMYKDNYIKKDIHTLINEIELYLNN